MNSQQITINQAVEETNRQLQMATVSINRLQEELISHLVAVALGAADNGRSAELRSFLQTHRQTVEEAPQVLTRLFAQESALQEQTFADDRLAEKQETDQIFFDLLNRIIAAGTASPAELLLLRKHAASSSNPARKYDIDRLTEALEDHDRQVSAAKSWNREPPVFSFALEENGGQP